MGPILINNCQTSQEIDWVAIAAGVIALCALVVSLWQAYLSRRHNYLSLRPLLEIYAYAAEDKAISLGVKNLGTGPAIIRSTHLTYKGVRYNISDRASFDKLADAWQEDGAPGATYHASFPDSNAVVGVGDSFYIMELIASSDRAASAAFFTAAYRNTIIDIAYESLYGTKHTIRYEQQVFAHA